MLHTFWMSFVSLLFDSTCKIMSQAAINMMQKEGSHQFTEDLSHFLLKLHPTLLSTSIFFIKKILQRYRKKREASFTTGIISIPFANILFYPLDTIRK